VLLSRQFQPWEGGEGVVLAQYVRAHVLLGHRALLARDAAAALRSFRAAAYPPESIGEAPHLLSNRSMIYYWLGAASDALGEPASAVEYWQRAARSNGDFQQMQVQPISEMTFWSAMALRRLGHESDASALFRRIGDYAAALERERPTIDYFATSLPTLLLFEEDLNQRQTIRVRFLQAQSLLGLGNQASSAQLFQEVLRLDRSHTGAIDFAQEFAR